MTNITKLSAIAVFALFPSLAFADQTTPQNIRFNTWDSFWHNVPCDAVVRLGPNSWYVPGSLGIKDSNFLEQKVTLTNKPGEDVLETRCGPTQQSH